MERLFGAFNLAAKAMGMTTQQLNKALEQGQVLAKDLLPKITPMIHEMANANGALAKQLESARIAENRFVADSAKAADKIFNSGFESGLTELYKTMSEILKDAGPQLEKIGKIFGVVFKSVAHILKTIEPPLSMIINNIEYLAGAVMIRKLMLLRATLATTFLPITVALAAAEELISLFSDKLVGVTEKAIGRQINISEGTSTKLIQKDGKFYSDKSDSEKVMGMDFVKYGPIFGLLKQYKDSGFNKEMSKGLIEDIQSRATRSSTSKYYTPEPMKQMVTQDISIVVQGVTGEEVAYKVQRHLAEFAGNGGGR